MFKFTVNSKREDLQMFFDHCGEHGKFVRFLYLHYTQNGMGEVNAANELLERASNGDWINLKCDAYEFGYGQ